MKFYKRKETFASKSQMAFIFLMFFVIGIIDILSIKSLIITFFIVIAFLLFYYRECMSNA
jgi:hypothetical protein